MEMSTSIKYLKLLQTFLGEDFACTYKAVVAKDIKQLAHNSTYGQILREIVGGLQQGDILNQRIEHLIEALRSFPKHFPGNYLHAFLYLQSFHLGAVGHDLDITISTINLVARPSDEGNHRKEAEAILFTGYGKTKLVLNLAAENIIAAAKAWGVIGKSPLTESQICFCQQFYTTSQERTVLHLFQTQENARNGSDLLLSYAQHKESRNDSVQLF
jgi:hypothetical protein